MNVFGKLFNVTIYGESHQKAVGVIIGGMKSGIPFNQELLNSDLSKRKAGAIGTTKRIETDDPKIISGIYNGYFSGSPVHIMFENTNTQTSDIVINSIRVDTKGIEYSLPEKM